MNLQDIHSLIKMIDESGMDEMTIEEGDFKITLKRQSDVPVPASGNAPMFFPMPQMPFPQAPPAAAPPVQAAASPPPADAVVAAKKYKEIRSPMVGTFYRAPSPEANPYVQVGDQVTKGKVLCIIEAMKLMNEIESDVDGKIVKIMVENAQPVEYDQVLFLVE